MLTQSHDGSIVIFAFARLAPIEVSVLLVLVAAFSFVVTWLVCRPRSTRPPSGNPAAGPTPSEPALRGTWREQFLFPLLVSVISGLLVAARSSSYWASTNETVLDLCNKACSCVHNTPGQGLLLTDGYSAY